MQFKVEKVCLFCALIISPFSFSIAQKQLVTKDIIADFSKNYYYKCRYEQSDNLRAYAYLVGRTLGYGIADCEVAIEQISKKTVFREALFKFLAQLSGRSFDLLFMNLQGIGMRSVNAKPLAEYIFNKYIISKDKEITSQEDKVLETEKSEIKSAKSQVKTSASKLNDKVVETVKDNRPKARKSRVSDTNSVSVSTDFTVLSGIKSVENLYKVYGQKNISKRKSYDEDGNERGFEYILFSNTNNEVIVLPIEDGTLDLIFKKENSSWVLPNNLKINMPVKDLISINQKDFNFYGFEWDYGGLVSSWNEGKLESAEVSVTLTTSEQVNYNIYKKFMGSGTFSTSDDGVNKLSLKVSEIIIQCKNQ